MSYSIGQHLEKVLALQDKIESLKQKHAAELKEMQQKLNAEIKIREMLQIRLEDEQRARYFFYRISKLVVNQWHCYCSYYTFLVL